MKCLRFGYRLAEQHTVVFSRKPGGSYIMNDKTGTRIQLEEERGTFVMEVEFLEPDAQDAGFAGQGK